MTFESLELRWLSTALLALATMASPTSAGGCNKPDRARDVAAASETQPQLPSSMDDGGIAGIGSDNCNSPLPLGIPSTISGSTAGATLDNVEPCGTTITAPGVWYSVIGNGRTITATTCHPGTLFDTKLSVFCGSCASLTCIGGRDDDPTCGAQTLASTVIWCSRPGVQYRILVHGFGTATGQFVLTVNDNGIPCTGSLSCNPCIVSQPPGSTIEPEPCGANNNGGCNTPVPNFTTMNCGQTYYGTTWAQSNVRDTDWYCFTLTTVRSVTITMRPEFSGVLFLMNINSCNPSNIDFLEIADAVPCTSATITRVLGASTYYIFVAPGSLEAPIREGYPCALNKHYSLQLLCGPQLGEPTARIPIEPPRYSIDLVSPTILDGFLASDVLRHPGPAVVIPAPNLGLVGPENDELDGLSEGNPTVAPADTFVLLFSVDRPTVGAVPPDAGLVALGFPYNVQEQAAKRQAAGDVYMSLLEYTRSGPLPLASSYAENNTPVRNQGDAGGVGMSLDPPISPDNIGPLEPPDEVDAGFVPKGTSALAGLVQPIFFSLKQGSPSLGSLPGTGSGGDVYIDTNPGAPGGEILFASPGQMGLLPGDEVDALLVFAGNDPFFNPPFDQVIFSLAPGSPSLGGNSPADLFTTTGPGVFGIFARAHEYGLRPADNVDMVDFFPCDDVLDCVNDYAIGRNRRIKGDMNCDGVVDFFDIDPFILALVSPAAYQLQYPSCNRLNGDMDGDAALNNFDIDPFVSCLVNGPGPFGCP